MTAAMVIGGASLSGVGLAAYATGGEIGGIVAREAPATPLGANTAAIAPDRYAETESGGIVFAAATGPYECEGCGPTLADRRAMAAAARYEAALQADEARFASATQTAVEPQSPIVFEDEVEPVEPKDDAGRGVVLAAYSN